MRRYDPKDILQASRYMQALERRSPEALVEPFLDPLMSSVLNRNEHAGERLLTLCSVPVGEASSLLQTLKTYHVIDQLSLLPVLGITSYFMGCVQSDEDHYGFSIMPKDKVKPFLSKVIRTTRPRGDNSLTYINNSDHSFFETDPPGSARYGILGDIEAAVTLRDLVISNRNSAEKRGMLDDFTSAFTGTATLYGERLVEPMIKAVKSMISLQAKTAYTGPTPVFDLVKIRNEFGRFASNVSQMPRA